MKHAKEKAPQGVVMFENINLEHFERLVYSKDYEKAGIELLVLLRKLRTGAEFIGHPMEDAAKPKLYSRLAAAILSLFGDPGFGLSQEGFDRIGCEHAMIDAVMRASVFGNAEHLLPQFTTMAEPDNPASMTFTSATNLVKFLSLYSLDSDLDMNYRKIFEMAPNVVLGLYIGMLSHLAALTPRAYAAREHLLSLGPIFEDLTLRDAMLPSLSDAYMYASYACRDDKHLVKKSINKMLVTMLKRAIPVDMPIPINGRSRENDARPRILVCNEWFTSLHAMYRCYAPALTDLKKHFHLTGAGRDIDSDATARALFDDWIMIPNADLLLEDLADDIRRRKFDMILYPSVGMALWWVALSNIRLAPIQVVSLGHPATTMSEAIDYVIAEENIIGDDSLASEQIIELPTAATRYTMRHDADFPAPVFREQPDPFTIGIPSMGVKINMEFLDALKAIADAVAPRVLKFRFMPNVLGVQLYLFKREVQQALPNSLVEAYPRTSYPEYLRVLSGCDLHLSPFPFGGTNSNIDSMKMAIPIITLEGKEPHATVDAQMLRRIGSDEVVIAETIPGYIDTVTWLINNPDDRRVIHEHLKEADIEGAFFGEGPDHLRDAWPRAFRYIYENHESITAKRTAPSVITAWWNARDGGIDSPPSGTNGNEGEAA